MLGYCIAIRNSWTISQRRWSVFVGQLVTDLYEVFSIVFVASKFELTEVKI